MQVREEEIYRRKSDGWKIQVLTVSDHANSGATIVVYLGYGRGQSADSWWLTEVQFLEEFELIGNFDSLREQRQ